MQTKTEQELIQLSLEHDSDAYAQLVDRYKVAIYNHSFSIVLDEDIAEDITQETFINAYYKLMRYDTSRKFSTWLFKISTNAALNSLKKNKRIIYDETAAESIISLKAGPDEKAIYDEARRAVAKLKPTYRTVVSLYYWQGLSYQEISEMMDAPLGSIKVWMRRAKEELRKDLE